MEYRIDLWGHQAQAIERAKNLPYFALLFQMGTGKTATAINILRHKINQKKKMLRTLIFCPPVVIRNWQDEFQMHSKIKSEEVVALIGSGEKRLKLFNDAADRPRILISNYESLLMPSLYKALQEWQPEALIFDESHRLKNYSAKRSKLAEKLANPKIGPRPLVYILSGTPILNSPMDIFYQFLILDGGVTFGRNFFIFRAKYFMDKNAWMNKQSYFPNWIVRPGALDEINRLIFSHAMRVTKEEALDLPEELSITIKCEMTGPQKKNYLELKKDLVTYVRENPITAPLAIVKALRLMQITSGYLPLPTDSQGEVPKEVYKETEKDEKLKNLLEEITPHSKVIVWAVYKQNYVSIRRICEELGVSYCEVHGEISREKQDENVKAFQNKDSIRVFLGHPGSGGVGINITCAPYSIFYSRTFSLEHYLQARARNHRGGQKNKVTHYDLVCQGTIEETVQKALANKEEISETLLASLK